MENNNNIQCTKAIIHTVCVYSLRMCMVLILDFLVDDDAYAIRRQ